MKVIELPPVERLHELFYYEDGVLYRRVSASFNTRAGDRAGSLKQSGYIGVAVGRKLYLAHRLIWTMHHGVIPAGMEIDHINGDKADNRIENLRLATRSENNRNLRGAHADSRTGIRGVSPYKSGRWHAQVHVNGRNIQRYFKSQIAAVIFADLVRAKYFGDFYNPPVTPGLAELLE